MLQFLIDFAVPVTIFVSILISGTEARAADLPNVVTTNRTLVLGSADQLLVLPFVALLTQILAQPSQLVTTSLLLLALCQGGGISKYYSYVARCNVPVSATIPALSTILSFFFTSFAFKDLLSALFREAMRIGEFSAQTGRDAIAGVDVTRPSNHTECQHGLPPRHRPRHLAAH